MVIHRRGSYNDGRLYRAEQFGDAAAGFIIIEDREVSKLGTKVVGPKQATRGSGFVATDLGDCVGVVLGRAAVAWSHRYDRDRVPLS